MEYRALSEKEYNEAFKAFAKNYEQTAENLLDECKGYVENDDKSLIKKQMVKAFLIAEQFAYNQDKVNSDVKKVLKGENPFDVIYNQNNKLTKKFFHNFLKKAKVSDRLSDYVSHISDVVELYKKEESVIVKKGEEIRKKDGFKPPNLFKNADTVVFEIPKLEGANETLLSRLDEINQSINGDKNLTLEMKEGKPFLAYGKNLMRPVSFFKRRAEALEGLNIDFDDKALFDKVLEGDFNKYKAFLKTRKDKSNPIVNKDLCRVLEDEFVFNHLSYEMTQNNAKVAVEKIHSIYTDTKNRLEQQSSRSLDLSKTKKDDDRINAIILTIAPLGIARMSNYSLIRSCMSPKGRSENPDEMKGVTDTYKNLYKEIGAGTIVAYGINLDNPYKKISRVNLKPYQSKNGQTMYMVGKVYGKMIPYFKEAVVEIAKNELNADKDGLYKLKEGAYVDNQPELMAKGDEKYDFREILDLFKTPYKNDKEGNIAINGDFDFSKVDIPLAKIDFKNKVNIKGLANFMNRKDITMIPEKITAEEYGVFACPNFRYVNPETKDEAFNGVMPFVVKRWKDNYIRDFKTGKSMNSKNNRGR